MFVRTVSRIHMGLIDMNGELGRIDGGVGLALDEPYIQLSAESANRIQVSGPISGRVHEAVLKVLSYIDGDPIRCEIQAAFPQHVGLGSGTQAALAGGLAACRLNGSDLQIRQIAEITGRGGTSGIGTAAFEMGGFILDGGHLFKEKGRFLPSSEAPAPPPPVLANPEFPEWEIAVILPKGKGAHGREENSLFQEICPIPQSEVESVCRIVVMKLLPSIVNKEFDEFREAIRLLQEIGFKRRELDLQPLSRELVKEIHDLGYAAGMSSFGPAVYAIHPDQVETDDLTGMVYKTRANKSGAEISID